MCYGGEDTHPKNQNFATAKNPYTPSALHKALITGYSLLMLCIPSKSLLLAPMVELSHRALREFIEDYWPGADFYWTEMASTKSYLTHAPFERYYLDILPQPEKTVIQWFTSTADDLVKAVTTHYEETVSNNSNCAGYDVNFACSAPHIERTGGGIKWMQKPLEAAAMIRTLRTALPDIQLTAKLRLGYKDDIKSLETFCIAIAEAGLDAIILHPRFKHEKFKIRNHWDYIEKIAASVPVPLIGNGDITSFEKANNVLSTYKLHGIMIGREAVRRPWIFYLIKNKMKDNSFCMEINLETTALTFLVYVKQYLPEPFHLSRIKRFFLYYCDNLKFGHHLRHAIQNAKTVDTIPDLITNYFTEVPEERIKYET